jgi:SnoaL-like protein
VSIHDDSITALPASPGRAKFNPLNGTSDLPQDFDQIAIAVDWLDACRMRDLEALLDLYALDAALECQCHGTRLHEGRAALEAYWRPLLDNLDPTAYKLQEIVPVAGGVALDCLNSDGKPIRVLFGFTADGKIAGMRCAIS